VQLNLNAEQQLLQDSVARFIGQSYDFEKRTSWAKACAGGSDTNWRTFAENGWLAAAIAEDYGGVGGSVLDTVIISQQFGRGLVIEPYLGCAVLATQTLLAAGTPAQCSQWLPSLCDGSRRLALAYSEPASRGLPEFVATRAQRTGSGYLLHGRKTLVLGAVGADGYICSARTSGKPAESDGISLFLLPPHAPQLSVTPLPLHDGSLAAELAFEGVYVEDLLGEPDRGLPAIREGLAHAILALCAELIGAMERTIEITADYLRSRKQFNVPLASFQSLQHRMADMAAEMELARSMLFAALASFENDDAATRLDTVSAAKAFITNAARNVCGQGIQLHGGIGMTEDYVVGHYFKRAAVADVLLGGGALHEAACAKRLQSRIARDPATGQVSTPTSSAADLTDVR
jgi:alkylation response protein AidB-like acyl-CoA dehydrogenase